MKHVEGYFTMGLDCGIGWPSQERTVCFRGHEITLKPETETDAPSVVMQVDKGMTQDEARQVLQEFLSGLAWVRRGRLAETFSTFCSGAPVRVGKGVGHVIDDAPVEYVPDPNEPRAKLALALYREALSVNVVPYQFLGFFKVINVLHGSGSEQRQWINSNLPGITDQQAKKRLAELHRECADIGEYLYASGRCAVAHAFSTPVINPDKPEDVRRLAADVPVIRALAEYAIARELGVKSLAALHDEHLYELEGFRELFGQELVGKLKAPEPLDPACLPLPARLSLKLREKDQLPSFQGMEAEVASITNGFVDIRLFSPDRRIEAVVVLSFPDERLWFDALNWLSVWDDGTAEAARRRIDALVYLRDSMANGVNEVWDTSRSSRLGRSQPVILVNMRPDWDGLDKEIADSEKRLDDQDAANGRT